MQQMSHPSTRFDHAAFPLTQPHRGAIDRTLKGRDAAQIEPVPAGSLSARTIVWRVIGALAIAAAFYLLVVIARHGQALDTIMSWITFGQRGR
jgi:hypothetical protein